MFYSYLNKDSYIYCLPACFNLFLLCLNHKTGLLISSSLFSFVTVQLLFNLTILQTLKKNNETRFDHCPSRWKLGTPWSIWYHPGPSCPVCLALPLQVRDSLLIQQGFGTQWAALLGLQAVWVVMNKSSSKEMFIWFATHRFLLKSEWLKHSNPPYATCFTIKNLYQSKIGNLEKKEAKWIYEGV